MVYKGSSDAFSKISHTLLCLVGATRRLTRVYRAGINTGGADINADRGDINADK